MAKFNRQYKQGEVGFVKIVSSNIDAVKYEDAEEALVVEFRGGARYRYSSVKRETYDSLLAAPSKGKYLAENIKGKYNMVKIRQPREVVKNA